MAMDRLPLLLDVASVLLVGTVETVSHGRELEWERCVRIGASDAVCANENGEAPAAKLEDGYDGVAVGGCKRRSVCGSELS